jgi:tetratricopeptide (TPR) repeat protein
MPLFDRLFGKKEEEKQPLEHTPERTVPLQRAFNVGDKILNHYEVKAVLGGGMGDVYIALDTEWNQLVAIKTFKDEYFGSEEAINRFMREAETWVDLERHTNIVSADFVQRIPKRYGKPYIFIEFIEGDERYGVDLSGYIGHLDIPQALDFAIQFCTGMCYALDIFSDLVNRDIKPDNVMITKDRVAKITDFGLVKTLDESKIEIKMEKELKALCHTRTGSCFGTVPYMAPEQFMDATSVDTRADIYSFGVMLYEMLTTRLPFYATNSEEYLNKHLNDIPKNPKTLNHNIPDELDALVMKCLEKKPEYRYSSFRDLQNDLIEIYNKLTGEEYVIKGRKEELSAGNWNNKGLSYARLGLFEKAEDAYRNALRLNPNNAVAHNNLGALLQALKRLEEAEREYRETIRINPKYTEAHNNLGNLLKDLEKEEEAEREYREAIRINPNDSEIHLNLGSLLENLKRLEEAESEYREAIRINPNDADVHFILGLFLLEKLKRVEEAEKEYREAIRLNSNHVQAHMGLGSILWLTGRKSEAEGHFNKLLRLVPDSSGLIEKIKELTRDEYIIKERKGELSAGEWNNKGVSYANLGLFEKAEDAYRAALMINLNYAEAHNNLGLLLANLNRLEEAKREYREAIRINPNYTEAHINLGRLLANLKRFEEAEKEYREAIRIDPYSVVAHNNLGNLLKDFKRFEEAEREYREAIRINLNYAEAHNNLGLLLKNFKRIEEAEKEYREAIRINPNFAVAHNNLGLLLKDLKRFEEAEKEWREAIRINPNYTDAHRNLGLLLKDFKRFKEAEREYREAIRINPSYAEAHINLGVLLENVNREKEAEKEYREAIRINPSYAEAYANLGSLLWRTGRKSEAEEHFDKSLKFRPDLRGWVENIKRSY